MSYNWVGPAISALGSLGAGLFSSSASKDIASDERAYREAEAARAFDREKELLALRASLGGGTGPDRQGQLLEAIKAAGALRANANNTVVSQLNNLAQIVQAGYLRGGR